MKTEQIFKFKNLINRRFGYLVALRIAGRKHHRILWECLCDCGNTAFVISKYLINGRTISCGCYRRALQAQLNTTHNMSTTRFCKIWYKMLQRCNNPNDSIFSYYGGRGITVCERWNDFNNFKEDMYESYNYHVKRYGENNTSIDRINVNGNYEPSNCKWATDKEQARHTTVFANTKNYEKHDFWRDKLIHALNNLVRTDLLYLDFCSLYLGIPVDEFKYYIQSKFKHGMTWDNWGRGYGKWQLDHVIGCNNFDLSKLKDRIACFNYKNLQPLWYEDHVKKSTKRHLV